MNSLSAQTIKPKCLDGNCKNKIGTFIYSDSSIYVGSFVDKLRSGQGKITFRNKSSYDGQWLNDKRNGIGVYIDSIGNKYEGNWVDDVKSGNGKYTDNQGNVYEGTWTNGELTGHIVIRYKNKSLYEGEYNQGIRGQGKMTYTDGSIYSGNFAKNKRSGYGEMVYSFGVTYKGNWVSNEVEGQGQFYLTSSQLQIAQGIWKTDKTIASDLKFINAEGYMVCYYSNKNLYYGKSQEGLPNSSGKMSYSNGDVYEGNFVKGVYHGKGKLTLKDKTEYNGNWKSGKKDGYGTLTNVDKTTLQGYWSSDNYLGLEQPVFQNLGQINCEYTPLYYLYDKFFLCLDSISYDNNQDFLVYDKNFKKIDNIKCQRIKSFTSQFSDYYVNERNEYDLENHFNDYFLIKDKSGKKNLLLENLSSSTKFIYDEIFFIPDTKHFVVAMNNKNVSYDDNSEIVFTGIIDSKGKEVPIESYNSFESSLMIGRGNEGLYELNIEGKFGFKDEHGNVIISPRYDEVEPFSDGLAVVYVGDKYGYINKKGEEIIQIHFKFDTLSHYLGNEKDDDDDEFRSFRNGFAITEINGKYGIIKKNGSKLFNETFDNIFILNKKNEQGLQLFIVMKILKTDDYLNDKVYGIINENGEYIINCKYGLIHEFNDVFVTALNNKYGLLNKYGNVIFSNQFSSFLDSKLNGQTSGYYQTNEFFSNEKGLIIVESERKYGLVSTLGKWIIPCKYDQMTGNDICQDYFLIRQKNKFGLINKNGEIVIPLIYDYGALVYGYFEFRLNNESILINRYGKVFFRYANYRIGKVKIIKNKIGFLVMHEDSAENSFVKFVFEDGSEIVLNNYTDVKIVDGLDYILVESNNKYGAIDINGKIVLEIKYDKIETFRNKKYCKVHLNGKCELLNFE